MKVAIASLKEVLMTVLIVTTMVASLFSIHMFFTAGAHADPLGLGRGCETVRWGFLGLTQKRTVCDTDKRPDGSWERQRIIWTPAHRVPFTCNTYGYRYSASTSCYGGYDVDTTIQEDMKYIVFDYNVVQGEPGWLPPGTNNVIS